MVIIVRAHGESWGLPRTPALANAIPKLRLQVPTEIETSVS